MSILTRSGERANHRHPLWLLEGVGAAHPESKVISSQAIQRVKEGLAHKLYEHIQALERKAKQNRLSPEQRNEYEQLVAQSNRMYSIALGGPERHNP